jgi:hypothetical protein
MKSVVDATQNHNPDIFAARPIKSIWILTSGEWIGRTGHHPNVIPGCFHYITKLHKFEASIRDYYMHRPWAGAVTLVDEKCTLQAELDSNLLKHEWYKEINKTGESQLLPRKQQFYFN